MRVTQKILFGNFMRDINRNRSEMGMVQSDLSSGRTVRLPSQDPVSFRQSRAIGDNIRKEEQYQRNISSGLRQARLAQQALDEGADLMIEMKRILVQGASESSDAKARETMADEVAGLRDTLVSIFNTSYGDRYLFAGTNSDTTPFEVNGTGPGGVENRSSATPPAIMAGDSVRVEISIDGVTLRDTDSGDLFEVISDLEQALRDDDTESLSTLFDRMDSAIEHVVYQGSRLGNTINQMEFMAESYTSSTIAQSAAISELVDTDYAQAFSELHRIQIAYESAMAVHSTMLHNTLLDYI